MELKGAPHQEHSDISSKMGAMSIAHSEYKDTISRQNSMIAYFGDVVAKLNLKVEVLKGESFGDTRARQLKELEAKVEKLDKVLKEK